MNTYTPPQGTTPAGQQLASNQVTMGNMSSGQLGGMAANQQTAINQVNSPEVRQEVVNSTNIPGQQANYEDLARQLFELDKNTFAPQYNPTPEVQPGAVSSPGVAASPLDVSVEGLTGMKPGFTNPTYAVTAQTRQKAGIVDLLDTLNASILKELTTKRGDYKSRVGEMQGTLDTILRFMDKAEDREQREIDRKADAAKAKNLDTSITDVNGRRVLIDNQTGEVIRDLGIGTNPTLSTKTQAETDQLRDRASSLADARAKLEKSGSGPQYFGSPVRAKIPGALSQEANDTMSAFATLNKDLFKVAGTAFTKSEASILEGIKLDLEKTPEANKTALDQAETIVNRGLTRKVLRSQGWTDQDIEEYLKEQGWGL